MERDYYRILEVSRDASEREIKRAYHRLARERHPDKGTTPSQVKRLQDEFAQISTAYNILKDKQKRSEYDARLKKDEAKRAEAGEPAQRTTKAAASSAKPRPGMGRDRSSIAQRAYAKGIQLFNAGDYRRAVEFFEAAIQNDDSEATYHARLGLALMRSHGGFARAVSAIKRAIELDPYNTDHRLVLGNAYETVGSTSMATKTYREILKWDSSNAEAMHRLERLGSSGSVFDKLLKMIKRQ